MNLFPKAKKPYYIYSPSYTHKSSGIRTLHLLCHALNESGYVAQLVCPGELRKNPYFVNPDLNTPVAIAGQFEDPIVVYPDITIGNPLDAKNVVRYLLAPRGAYGGDKEFPDTDNIWGALPTIADKVLRIPVSDPDIFFDGGSLRSGSCFYSHKYEMHENKLLDTTKDSIRLDGSLENIADILRKSTVCYLYELTSVITEAALCGCPVVLVRTPYFNTIDSSCMMGDVTWSDGEVVKTLSGTNGDYLKEYNNIVHDFCSNLKEFIKDTQGMVQ